MPEIWTEEEMNLIYTEMSDAEIAAQTGRSQTAVRKKRYKEFGHYVEESKQREKRQPVMPVMSDYRKEARILSMAKIMRVKLLG